MSFYDKLAFLFLHVSLEVSSMVAIGGKLKGEVPGGETSSKEALCEVLSSHNILKKRVKK